MADSTAIVQKAQVSIVHGCLQPTDFEGLYRMCQVVCTSQIRPYGCDTPEKVLVAAAAGMEAGLSFMQSLQNVMVVNNRATIWGDAVLGLCHASRELEEIEEVLEGEGDAMEAVCTVTRKGKKTPVVRKFSVADAKTAGLWMKRGYNNTPTPWVTNPTRMLQMRARSFALRDAFPDVLRGLQVREEVEDYGVQIEQLGEDGQPIIAAGTPVDHKPVSRTDEARKKFAPESAAGAEPDKTTVLTTGEQVDTETGEVVDTKPKGGKKTTTKKDEPAPAADKKDEAPKAAASNKPQFSDAAVARLEVLKATFTKHMKAVDPKDRSWALNEVTKMIGCKPMDIEDEGKFTRIKDACDKWFELQALATDDTTNAHSSFDRVFAMMKALEIAPSDFADLTKFQALRSAIRKTKAWDDVLSPPDQGEPRF